MSRLIKGRNGGTLSVPEKGETHNPNGRPKKLVSTINDELKAEGYNPVSSAHVLDAFTTLINLPLAKIAAIANKDIFYKRRKYPEKPENYEMEIVYLEEGDNYPLLYRLAAKELIGKRGGEYLEKLLDRAYGKAKQSTEITGIMDIIWKEEKTYEAEQKANESP